MTNHSETLRKWEPLADLPEQMLATLRVVSNGTDLVATASYDDTVPSRSVMIDFGSVEAFKVYEEFSSQAISAPSPQMRLSSSRAVPWPFQEVINSRWVARVIDRNCALEDYPWRHFVILTLDVILHVMTASSSVTARRVDH